MATKVKKHKKGKKGKGTPPEAQYAGNSLTALISPQEAGKELNAATRLKYRPLERQYNQQLSASKEQQYRIGNWFTDYQREVSDALKRSKGIYNAAGASVTNFANQGNAQDAARQAQLNAAGARDAVLRGAAPDLANRAIAARSATARRSSLGYGLGNLRARGAANQTFLSNQRRNVAGQKLQAHMEEAGRSRLIRKDREQLAKDKGDFRIAYRGTLRSAERNYSLGLKTLALNKTKAKDAAALGAAKLSQQASQFSIKTAQADRRYRLDKAKYGSAKAKDLYQRRHHLGPYKKASKKTSKGPSAHSQKVIDSISAQISRAKSNYAHTGSKHQYYAWARVNGIDRDAMNAAADIAFLGHLSSTNRKRLKARGVHIPSGW